MTHASLKRLLQRYKKGIIPTDQVLATLMQGFAEPLGFATVDHDRKFRQGFPEVILAAGKTNTQLSGIAKSIAARGTPLLATRASRTQYLAIRKAVPRARYNPIARTVSANEDRIEKNGDGQILIVTAGTSDLPVAEEALETARIMGNDVAMLVDVGVAGIHRLLEKSDQLRQAAVIIVVAGMEGALPSVIGGLVSVPVIAVPTSTGYGASFQGISALLGMLNSCAAGVTVVNIDNGFGAAFAASRIIRKRIKGR
jgi:NCAIR mutase (PurE)-related protein